MKANKKEEKINVLSNGNNNNNNNRGTFIGKKYVSEPRDP